uniref:Uncharacterized protein n=1 Tax=Rhizophora mucronata TaxID=61149 RepID=A0A2P2P8U0_RHIMU
MDPLTQCICQCMRKPKA